MARAIARTIFSYVGWSQDRPAASPLPPLSPSAADDDTVTGPSVGASPRQPVDIEDDSAQSNANKRNQNETWGGSSELSGVRQAARCLYSAGEPSWA